MKNDIFTVQAPRWCRVRADSSPDGDLFPLDEDGFLGSEHVVAPPGSEVTPGSLASPSDVAREGATVLLGEPGAGKSTVLRSLVEGLWTWDDPSAPEGAHRYVWIDGPDVTADTWDEVVGDHLAGLPSAVGSPGTPPRGQLTMVIDQADESEICGRLPFYLRRGLRSKVVKGFRLLLACRTGDYPPSLTPVLHDAFGACSLVDLAPLSRADAVALVDSAGVPGQQLITEVVALRAGPLASVPLTLELLVREYQESGRLGGGARELFEDGVRLLSQEYNLYRYTVAAPVTTWPQRLEVAGRIAARLVLSGRRNLWRGSLLEERPRSTDLDVATLAGGTERTSGCQPFEVTPTVVDEVLFSGLFTASGNRRFAFRHSSLAAFLAARHLISRSVSDAALRRLFLVEASDQETAGIPVSLRETAAWLVVLAPDRTQWLASADPESLTMHSGLVQSDSVRELIVSRLLERAADVELGEVSWHRTRWVLGHPGLARQLAPVLALDPGDFDDWEVRARVEVALQLAEQCPAPALAPLLLEVAADPRWPAGSRARAVRASFACDEEGAAPVLKQVLAGLGPGKKTDPQSSLRGALLTRLWPRFLDTETMLDALDEEPSSDRYGVYEHFVAGMPAKCPEEDVHLVVTWLARVTEGQTADTADRLTRFSEDGLVFGTVDRALSIPDPEGLLPDLARIVVARLLRYKKMEFPRALNPAVPDGQEPAAVRDLRRKLAHALLVRGIATEQSMRHLAFLIVREWEPRRTGFGVTEGVDGERHTLLGTDDFPWVLRTAADCAGDAELTDAYAQLAGVLFDPQTREHFELAYQSQDNPAWPCLRWFYEPIEIDSDIAKSWRRNHRAAFPPPWPESAKFAARQRERLQRAREHDAQSFWQLLWNMQCDPNTGEGQHRFDDDIRDWPGYSMFTAEEVAVLPDCALEFLRREHDYADEWLGMGRRDKRAWAGVLALSLLGRVDRMDELETDRWSSWVGAIADPWYVPSSTTWLLLLRRAAVNDPQGLSQAISKAARKQLSQGMGPLALTQVEAAWSPVVIEVWEDFLAALSTALLSDFEADRSADAWSVPAEAFEKGDAGRAALVCTWSDLLARLLAVDNALARSVVDYALAAVERNSDAKDLELPVRAAVVLLEDEGFDAWPRLRELVDASDRFSRALALKCAERSQRERVEAGTDEKGLVTLYRWLNNLFPQAHSGRPLGFYTMTPEMEALDWRDALPGTLSRRGTPEAVRQLKALAADFPTRLSLRAALVSARAQCLAATWTPAGLDEVVAILAGVAEYSDPALAEAERELVEALEAFQDMGGHAFRDGILRDMQMLMNPDRLLPIADHNLAHDHLRAIARYVHGAGGAEARLALLSALERARPEEKALERLRSLLAVPDGGPSHSPPQDRIRS